MVYKCKGVRKSSAEFGLDKSRQWYDMQNNVSKEHSACEQEIEAKIEPETEVIVVRRMR